MSRLLDLINRLKAQASWTMLTASQQITFAELEKRWQFPDRLNLCGPQGSGKTFVGWAMARQHQVHFYASPRLLEHDQPPYPTDIIIDNAPSEEKNLRRLLAELQLRQVHKVLFITSNPIHLGLPVSTLALPTKTDIATVYENCSRLQFYPSSLSKGDEEKINFWDVIYSVL